MPVGVQCPISSSLAIGIGSGVLGFRPYWCPSPFSSPSILGVFHSLLSAIGFLSFFFFFSYLSQPISSPLLFAFHTWCFPFALICHWISIVFLLYGRRIATHSVDPSLTHFLVSFQAWDWLWYPMLWSQRRNSGAHIAEISIQISALAGV